MESTLENSLDDKVTVVTLVDKPSANTRVDTVQGFENLFLNRQLSPL